MMKVTNETFNKVVKAKELKAITTAIATTTTGEYNGVKLPYYAQLQTLINVGKKAEELLERCQEEEAKRRADLPWWRKLLLK